MNVPCGLNVSTPSDVEIVMTRDFDAPRRLVWEAMTRPDLLRQWMYMPEGWTMAVCTGDVRVGGRFEWIWHGPDGQVSLIIRGEYREVNPPERIVHTEAMEMGCGGPIGELLATLVLTELAGRTSMRMTLLFDTKQARDGALASGMEHGMEAGYRQLDAYFSKIPK